MLTAYALRINELEADIKAAHEAAEHAGDVELPASVYANIDEVATLREQAAGVTIESNQDAITALRLAANGHDCAEARLIRRVVAFLAKK